jgi:hypothetical protein
MCRTMPGGQVPEIGAHGEMKTSMGQPIRWMGAVQDRVCDEPTHREEKNALQDVFGIAGAPGGATFHSFAAERVLLLLRASGVVMGVLVCRRSIGKVGKIVRVGGCRKKVLANNSWPSRFCGQ